MPARRLALVACLLAGPAALAQIQIDDRPKPLEDGKPLTKDELNRRKADQLLRDARAHFALGIIRQRHEKLIEAVSTLEKAATLDPDSLEVRRALIPLYAVIGRDDAALALARQVIDRDPFDLDTAFQYARLLRADGRGADAIPALQKAAAGKDAQERPERLLFLLSDLFDLLEKQGDFAGAARAQDGIIRTITEKREQLLYGNGFTREDLQASLARAYEGLGRACVKTKEYDRAVAAFRGARDTLLKCEDPEARHQAVRISLNVSEVAASQGRWADALEALDAYLEHSPAEVAPYETKIELLRKLGRDKDIVPALRKYAGKQEYHLGLQLLLARELGKDPRTRPEAEETYTGLLKEHVKPEVYKGLFQLYQAGDRMAKVIDHFDLVVPIAFAKEDKVKPAEREAAQERYRAMLMAIRMDPSLVKTLLPEALAELGRDKPRSFNTWWLLGNLARHTHQLDRAEQFFRQCLRNPPADREEIIYEELIRVLLGQRKFADVIALCESVLNGPKRGRFGQLSDFESSLAVALSQQGEFDKALPYIDRAIEHTNDEAQVGERRLKAQILAEAGRYGEAVRLCEETLAKFPKAISVIRVRQSLSNVYSLKGDHAKSEEQLRLILEMDPDEALANNNLGYQMADRNANLDEAERLIRRAIELDRSARKQVEEDGENAAYLDSLGWVLFRKGKLAEAREWLEKAAALPDGADDPAVWDHLGDVLAKLDQPAKAKEAWQKAARLYESGGRRKSDPRKAEVEKKLKTVE
jgi:tetratricopeptide (TPR) repeat protein